VGHVPGTGVGLATARLIVEQHGGSIDVHSRPGHGTTVTLRLPTTATERVREQIAPNEPEDAAARSLAGKFQKIIGS